MKFQVHSMSLNVETKTYFGMLKDWFVKSKFANAQELWSGMDLP